MPGLAREEFAERAGIHRTNLSDNGRARATSDRMRLPIPKRLTNAPSRPAPWGRLRHISGRRRFEDDRDRPVPLMSLASAGRVASPGLGVGRNGAMPYAAYRLYPALEADTRGRPSPIEHAAADPRSSGMSPTCSRPDGGGPRRARSPPGSRRSAATSGRSLTSGDRAPDRPDRRLPGRRQLGAGGRVPTAGHRPRRDQAALPERGGTSGRGPGELARDREGPRSSAFTGRW
jgi:hypothetical protein